MSEQAENIAQHPAEQAEGTPHAPGSTMAQLDDLETVFRQIVAIDQIKEKDAAAENIQAMMQAIGDYTGAARVYIFECLEDAEHFCNTYEWCAPFIPSRKDFRQNILAARMPNWYRMFREGKSVVIDDIKAASQTMPQECAILQEQGCFTAIAFPISHKRRLMGFIGLDDPDIVRSRQFISILAVVGSHLGGTWESFRMAELLQKNQNILSQSREALEKEKRFLETLARDYVSVYHIDLLSGRGEVIKIANAANSARFIDPSMQNFPDYMALLRVYVEQYVVSSWREDLLKALSPNSLRQELAGRERVGYRYHSHPNQAGQQYFEVQAVRMSQSDTTFQILLAFRPIDDLVSQELHHQAVLEQALREAEMNNEIISAISKIYVSIFQIDLLRDFYEEISSDSEIHYLTGIRGKASAKMREIVEQLISEEYHERVSEFFDLSTLPERLKEEDTTAVEYRAKDGNWHMARFVVKKRNAQGIATHVLYVTNSISDSKRREQNWIAIAEEANRANAAKTDFLSRIAHDIRTPMNALRGFTSITRQHLNDPEKVREGLDKIEISGRYLQQIVEDVMDLSKIEGGQMELHWKENSVAEIFRQFSDTAEGTLPEKQLEFRCVTRDIQYDRIVVDDLRLRQIYMNLLSNAIKYTPEGGSVSFEMFEAPCQTPGKIKLIAVVQDTGIGMSEEFMQNMYTKFSRAVDTRVNKVRGTGLGLAIVKQLVDLMGGTIEVQSALGKGTTFRVTFQVTYLEGEQPAAKPEVDLEGAKRRCAGMHLLVAEDNDLNYEVASELLALYDITCDRAEDGSVCVEKFQTAAPGTYDAILMDLQMPVMDGIQATSAIRHLSRSDSKSIPILAMTASALQQDITDCLSAMNAHLAKPLEINKLLEVLSGFRKG